MRVRFPSIGRIFAVLMLSLLSLSYSRADNILSISGLLHPALVTLDGGSASIAPFYTYNGYFSWVNAYTDLSESTQCLNYDCTWSKTDYSAVLNGGSIQFSLDLQGQSYLFSGAIVSGNVAGYYCLPQFLHADHCSPQGNEAQTSFHFDGTWSNGWLAQGDLSMSGSDLWGVGNFSIETQIPESNTPEPSTLLMLGSGILGFAGVIRRRLLG